MIWQRFMFVGMIQVPGDKTLTMDEEHNRQKYCQETDLIFWPSAKNFGSELQLH